MKKYLITILCVTILYFFYQFLVYEKGFYIKLQHDEVQTNFTIKDNQIVQIEDGKQQPFTSKGVIITSAIPTHNASDYAMDKEGYLEWFAQIHDMGANTIRVFTIMDDDFYDALYTFNQSENDKLYLLQGIDVGDYAQNNKHDAYSDEFFTTLCNEATTIVDVIHGKKNILLNRGSGEGIYRQDVSPYVLGFIVGSDWNSETIAYTNQHAKDKRVYDGAYLYTSDDANSFEALLARVMDTIIKYETKKYDTQHLVSFSNDANNDPFTYNDNYALQMRKVTTIDAQHIQMKENAIAGMFATYRSQDMVDGVIQNIIDEDVQDLISNIDTSSYNHGYTKLLTQYHTMPVLIGSYGFSSSRGIESEADVQKYGGPLNEQQQGEALINTYKEFIDNACVGAIINSWNDNWGIRTWNTSFAKDVDEAIMWGDVQTNNTGYGLLSFDGAATYFCDGNNSEWSEQDKVLEQNDSSLYMHTDDRYVYLMVKKNDLQNSDTFYVGFDVSDKSGSNHLTTPALSFNRAIDFLLTIQGTDNTKLLVNERYNAMRENYLVETKGDDPFVTVPEYSSTEFQPVEMILRTNQLIEDFANTPPLKRLSPTFETGALKQGNNNPNSDTYNSQADVCYGDGFVEVRIPWLLLNFSNPSEALIHDDYYEHYGVETIVAENLYVGIVDEQHMDTIMELQPYKLETWSTLDYKERLKKSYQILSNAWKEGVEE